MSKHGVVRTDNLTGTIDGSKLKSLRYYVGNTKTDIDNGCFVVLSGLLPGERELYKAVAPTANEIIGNIVLVATPEMKYDKTYYNLSDFYNVAGSDVRGYVLEAGDMFSVTAEVLDGTPSLTGETPNKYLEIQAGVKGKVASSADNARFVLEAIEVAGADTFYVYRTLPNAAV